jgi:predicted HicB family RNase H-like nuclease
MKRTTLRFRNELYERVKLMAKEYNLSINKMIIKLIEIGYLKMLGAKDE